MVFRELTEQDLVQHRNININYSNKQQFYIFFIVNLHKYLFCSLFGAALLNVVSWSGLKYL